LKVWKTLDCKTFREYHDIYLTVDVMGLADVMENFRSGLHASHNLDPAHYLSAPHFSWDAFLKSMEFQAQFEPGRKFLESGIQLFWESPTETQRPMFEFVSRARRGGMSFMGLRYASEGVLRYFDANALYSACARKPLPFGSFSWIEGMAKELLSVPSQISSLDPNGRWGYYFEVDLEYPKHLHFSKAHSSFPLCPEQLKIDSKWLSPTQLQIVAKHTPVEKLIPSFFDKKNYVLHFTHLQQVLRLGLRLVKVHKILRFHQDSFMRKYIDLNISLRQASKTEFGKFLFKLLNNSVYGKTIENILKRRYFRLIEKKEMLSVYVSRPDLENLPNYDDFFDFGVLVPKEGKPTMLNKPVQIGVTILEHAKVIMNNFHFNFMLRSFPTAELLFTDTDSLCYQIPHMQNEEFDSLLLSNPDTRKFFDFSNYPSDHPLFSNANRQMPGFFKDECPPPNRLKRFVGLRPKCYALEFEDSNTVKKSKGVNQKSLASSQGIEDKSFEFNRMELKFRDYENALFFKRDLMVKQARLKKSKEQKIHTEIVSKIGLSCFDDKYLV